MNPELPAPQFNPEQAPMQGGQNQEFGQNLPNPEFVGERSREYEQQMRTVDMAAAPPPPPMPMVVPAPVVAAPSVAPPATNDTPILASDDDLIEKEWVDQAKRIIMDTKNDPYRREQEVSRLQADYLRKRYGKEIGTAD